LRKRNPASPQSFALYARLTYRSNQPVRFHIEGYAAGQKVRSTSSNIAPAYPAGEGEALAWMSYKDPTKIDEIRIEATGQSWAHPLASINVPAQLEWTPAAMSNPRAPAWFARLDREKQDRALQDEKQRPKNTDLGWRIIGSTSSRYSPTPFCSYS
jgi:hypothetical protein